MEQELFGVIERNARLKEKNARLRGEVGRLHEKVARLQQQLAAARKDSSTSSKPPSSDIVKPKKPLPKGGKKRKKGGQPGHEQHMRSPFPPEAVDRFQPHTLDCCPDCGGKLVHLRREPEVLQQVEILETPTVVTQHQGLAYWCPHCRKVRCAPMPEAAREQVMTVATTRVPDAQHARKLVKQFLGHGAAYSHFITTPGIDPTNNLAEQAIRCVVIDRHITHGARSEKSRRRCGRIWTGMATCAQQARAVFPFLLDLVQAHLCGTSPASLLLSVP